MYRISLTKVSRFVQYPGTSSRGTLIEVTLYIYYYMYNINAKIVPGLLQNQASKGTLLGGGGGGTVLQSEKHGTFKITQLYIT